MGVKVAMTKPNGARNGGRMLQPWMVAVAIGGVLAAPAGWLAKAAATGPGLSAIGAGIVVVIVAGVSVALLIVAAIAAAFRRRTLAGAALALTAGLLVGAAAAYAVAPGYQYAVASSGFARVAFTVPDGVTWVAPVQCSTGDNSSVVTSLSAPAIAMLGDRPVDLNVYTGAGRVSIRMTQGASLYRTPQLPYTEYTGASTGGEQISGDGTTGEAVFEARLSEAPPSAGGPSEPPDAPFDMPGVPKTLMGTLEWSCGGEPSWSAQAVTYDPRRGVLTAIDIDDLSSPIDLGAVDIRGECDGSPLGLSTFAGTGITPDGRPAPASIAIESDGTIALAALDLDATRAGPELSARLGRNETSEAPEFEARFEQPGIGLVIMSLQWTLR